MIAVLTVQNTSQEPIIVQEAVIVAFMAVTLQKGVIYAPQNEIRKTYVVVNSLVNRIVTNLCQSKTWRQYE